MFVCVAQTYKLTLFQGQLHDGLTFLLMGFLPQNNKAIFQPYACARMYVEVLNEMIKLDILYSL